jgi:hypothetical protein
MGQEEEGMKRRLNCFRDGKTVRTRTGLPSIHRNDAFHREIRKLEKIARQNSKQSLEPRLVKRPETGSSKEVL